MVGRRPRETCSLRYITKQPCRLALRLNAVQPVRGPFACSLNISSRRASRHAFNMPLHVQHQSVRQVPYNGPGLLQLALPLALPDTRPAAQLQLDKVVNRPAAPGALLVHAVVGIELAPVRPHCHTIELVVPSSVMRCPTAMLLQVDKWRKAAEDAQRRLDLKENIMVELSRDGSKLDKERYLYYHAVGSCKAADRRHQIAAAPDAKASLLNSAHPPTAHLSVAPCLSAAPAGGFDVCWVALLLVNQEVGRP